VPPLIVTPNSEMPFGIAISLSIIVTDEFTFNPLRFKDK